MTESLFLRRLGIAEYEPVRRAMQALTDSRNESSADELWLVPLGESGYL